MNPRLCSIILAGILFFCSVVECYARSALFHATRKAVARKIKSKGFSIWKMKARSRFGKGIYLSGSARTATMERKGAKALLKVRVGKDVGRNSIDLTRPTKQKIRSLIRVRDMRGAVRKGIIGPKLGRRVGRYAGNRERAIRYRSTKDSRGANYFIPRSMIKKQPHIIHDIKIKTGKLPR